jgi:folate-binding protein YgfZ
LHRSWVSSLQIRGEDRQRFLNGMVTCDVQILEPGQGTYGFFTEVKGGIAADVVVRRLEDCFWLELPPEAASRIAEHLSRYIVADRVEIDPLSEIVPLTLIGPVAERLLKSLGLDTEQLQPAWQHRRVSVAGTETILSSDGRWGLPAYTFWVADSDAAGVAETLLEKGEPLGLRPVGRAAADVVRVEAGIPWYGQDFGPENLPQETAQDEAVSYTKGCYLGQEVVARLQYRGQVSRLLRGLEFDAPRPPGAGAVLLLEGREAGRVSSAVLSPGLRRVVGMAILRRRAMELGTRLDLEDGGEAVVVELPFGDRVL